MMLSSLASLSVAGEIKFDRGYLVLAGQLRNEKDGRTKVRERETQWKVACRSGALFLNRQFRNEVLSQRRHFFGSSFGLRLNRTRVGTQRLGFGFYELSNTKTSWQPGHRR